MFSLQNFPPTRFDLRFSVFDIPVRVHPLFWLIALLLGSNQNLMYIPVWVLIVFISVLIHELGHAFAMRYHAQNSQIVLHATGGATIPEPVSFGARLANVRLTPNQEIFITIAGPGAGFFFAAFIFALVIGLGGAVDFTTVLGFIPIPVAGIPGGDPLLNYFIIVLIIVNISWGLINLLPVYPLDGGQIVRFLFVKYDPWDGARKALWLSVIVGGAMAVIGFTIFGSLYMAIMFGMLAFQSYQILDGGGRY